MPKLHLASRDDATMTRCGFAIAALAGGASRIAPDAATGVCVWCLRHRRDAIESGEESEPFVAPPPAAARYGARDLSRTGRRAIEEAGREREPEARRWPSAEAAVRSYVRMRAESAELRSPETDPRMRVQVSRDPSLGGREHAAVERHRTVSLALSRAMDELAAALPHVPLSPADALDAYVLVVVGLGVRAPIKPVGGDERKGRVLEWRGQLPEDAATRMSERTGARVYPEHVEALVRFFTGAVRDALLASGELGAREPTPRRGWDPARRLREEAIG